MADLRHVSTWVFDLDNTLYPADCNLFAQVDQRMAQYISDALNVDLPHARYLQKDYYRRYGTTLNGLMKLHGLPPDPFLDFVHDIDVSVVSHAPHLSDAIEQLPGRKLIYTNGSRLHAERVANRLGVLHHFEDILDIAGNGYCAKPEREAFSNLIEKFTLKPEACAMFDDMPQNLEAPDHFGSTTILVHSDYMDHPIQNEIKSWSELPSHIDFATDDLTSFLRDTAQIATKPDEA